MPVLSKATWVTGWASSQSRRVTSSVAVVPKVRTYWARSPRSPGTRTQTAMVFLWTSSPATRSTSCSMARPPTAMSPGPPGADDRASLLGVLKATMRGADGSHVEFVADSWSHSDGDVGGPRCRPTIADFHAAWVGSAHDNSLAPSAARSTYRKYVSRAAVGRRLASGPFSSRLRASA